MAKPRTPQTYENALDKIKGDLTRERMADAVGKSISLIHKWTDEDSDLLPHIKQCELLDKAWMAENEGTPPIYAAYRAALGGRSQRPVGRFGDVKSELLDAYKAMQEASDKIRDAIADGVLTQAELRDIEQQEAIVHAELSEAIAAAKHECAKPRVVASDAPAEAAE